MKKNGFTLIELLGVIIILSLLALIAYPVIEQNIKYSADNVYNTQIKQIEKAAEDWGYEHLDQLPSEGSITVTLQELKTLGYIEKDIVNPKTNRPFNENTLIKITYHNNKYIYEVDETTIK